MTSLEPGMTVRATIHKRLWYDVTHDGWTLRVASSGDLAVKPNPDGSVQIVCVDGGDHETAL